ncbi:hypothetical protein ONZ45_g10635 [Pleurotus djamor]|nr:hypothetical protein ONZ45_g14477 [Pleurotus djamor]KAJ8506945.1 hypothetical protein ONZ45_g10635 [Pleurotus djamor]
MSDSSIAKVLQDHEAPSHEGKDAVEELALRPQPRIYVNRLSPPVGTGYWSRREYTVFTNHRVNDSGSSHYVTIDWKFAAYVYTTGARPDQPNFANSGGVMYIVLVHQGYLNSTLFPDSQDVTLTIRPPSTASPDRQLPTYSTQSGNYWPARIEYRQTLQMFQTGGNAIQPFDAEYMLDFQLEKMEQSGRTYNDRLEIFYRPLPGSAWQTRRELNALTVCRNTNPQSFPLRFSFEVAAKFHNRTVRATQTVPITLGFSM